LGEFVQFSPLTGAWLETALGGQIPVEANATCSDCAMCHKGDVSADDGHSYRPDVKCCSYWPDLPNYVVGQALQSQSNVDGVRRLMEQIQGGAHVVPAGIGPSRRDRLISDELAPELFGRSADVICPYFAREDGNCSIWPYRNSVCSTWFCKHVRGALGQTFWAAVSRLLLSVENTLTLWCMRQTGIPLAAFDALAFPLPLMGVSSVRLPKPSQLDVDRARQMWGQWWGREIDFFRRCSDDVARLKWDDVKAIGGPDLLVLAERARHAYSQLVADELPDNLHCGPVRVLKNSPQSVLVATYSSNDPQLLGRRVWQLLPRFDGRPTADVCKATASEEGLEIDRDLLKKLVDFRILVK